MSHRRGWKQEDFLNSINLYAALVGCPGSHVAIHLFSFLSMMMIIIIIIIIIIFFLLFGCHYRVWASIYFRCVDLAGLTNNHERDLWMYTSF